MRERRPPLFLVYVLCEEFMGSRGIFCKVRQVVGGIVRCWLLRFLFFGESCLVSGLGERDARPCIARVRRMLFGRCPASALKCIEPGPLGDASGSFSLVVASVAVIIAAETSCV